MASDQDSLVSSAVKLIPFPRGRASTRQPKPKLDRSNTPWIQPRLSNFTRTETLLRAERLQHHRQSKQGRGAQEWAGEGIPHEVF